MFKRTYFDDQTLDFRVTTYSGSEGRGPIKELGQCDLWTFTGYHRMYAFFPKWKIKIKKKILKNRYPSFKKYLQKIQGIIQFKRNFQYLFINSVYWIDYFMSPTTTTSRVYLLGCKMFVTLQLYKNWLIGFLRLINPFQII